MADEDLEPTTLYVRKNNMPKDEIEDVWDDTVLNNAYDRALKMANDEVAKRIAMETNSKIKEDSDMEEVQEKKPKHKKEKPSASKKKSHSQSTWKAGTPCRAVYDDDGLEYEAFIVKLISKEDCIVKFLGYDNEQKVRISSLLPTLGNNERMRQVEAAIGERQDDGFESQPSEHSRGTVSPHPVERPSNKKKKAQKKKKNNPSAGSDTGDLPHIPMPNLSMFKNMSSPMPMPPPPPLGQLSDRSDAEEQAISEMLLSWYMTGYYTGLYQGMKRQKQNGKRN